MHITIEINSLHQETRIYKAYHRYKMQIEKSHVLTTVFRTCFEQGEEKFILSFTKKEKKRNL